ncbi:Coq4 family protein [Sphingopyxis flava]|uniref:Ubiquinone biosynthesis protein COQ4 n=1 Tax=Sphingopyxis flava TaxID=1507287 RepID=A0A1T5DFM4_9SPHN|nr:Coq4 family protein [Sphingopyxis flava]SKB70514.1 ubiquinone biosynthesis protein COQ4 [Sphingopyxis flava]
MTRLPLSHPDRTDGGFRPMKALHHFRRLIADKEDTEQVFHIIDALRDKRFGRSVERFFETAEGQRVLAERPYLPALLDDHDALRRLPEASVGRVYVDFMEREGLTAQGLVDESLKFRRGKPSYDDMLEIYGDRLRDTHDLFHILTGYGRDALGEQCVLAFSYSQTPSWGTLFIAWAGAREIRKGIGRRYPIYAAVREGQRIGRVAEQIAHQNIEALLAEPLAAARKRLGILEPVVYKQVHAMMRADGIDPYDLLGTKPAEAGAAKPELAQAA